MTEHTKHVLWITGAVAVVAYIGYRLLAALATPGASTSVSSYPYYYGSSWPFVSGEGAYEGPDNDAAGELLFYQAGSPPDLPGASGTTVVPIGVRPTPAPPVTRKAS